MRATRNEFIQWAPILEPLDYPDRQKEKCKFFGCAATLSLEERLCGELCLLHSNLPKNTQPHGPHDPIRDCQLLGF